MQEPMRVIALSALVLPLEFIAQVAYQHHPPSSGEYAKVLEDRCRDAWQKPQEVVSALERIRAKYVKLTGNALFVEVSPGNDRTRAYIQTPAPAIARA